MIDILVWNDDYGMLPDHPEGCAAECRLLHDRSLLPTADAVIFHVPSLDRPVEALPKRPGQRWVAWSMESDANYPLLAHPAFLRNFDLTMTYRRDADVWVPYVSAEVTAPLARTPRAFPLDRPDDALAVYIASNPVSSTKRDDYVAELMRSLRVDSYGRCLNNRSWPSDQGRTTKLDTLARYPFTLAFENSVADDYVTEKFFEAFVAGSVPVYLGAPNVADFAPGDHSFVDVSAFAGPRELAEYLTRVANDPAAYEAFHAWRADGVRPEYRAMLEEIATDPLCRLVDLIRS